MVIRVLAVDDSVVVRRTIARALESVPDMECVATATNGRIALEKLSRIRPDVVVLDIEMPEMDGFQTLSEIRKLYPTLPVVFFSYINVRSSAAAVDALSRGVTEFVIKPTAADGLGLGLGADYVTRELVPVVRAIAPATAAFVSSPAPARAPKAPAARPIRHFGEPATISAVVIAASTGGPDALAAVITRLPPNLRVPVLVVQHMPVLFTRILAQRLDRISSAPVSEAWEGQEVLPGHIYVAPGELHMVVRRVGSGVVIHLDNGPKENYCRPSADVLFRSAAQVFGSGTLSLVMTGMGEDGMRGSEAVAVAGGYVIAQDPATATVSSMPAAVAGIADEVVPLDQIGDRISVLVARKRAQ